MNLDPVKSAVVDQKVLMEFPDVGETFTLHVRHSVAEIRERSVDELDKEDFHIHVSANASAWKGMLAGLRNPVTTLAGFEYHKGNTLSFARFMALFKPPKPKHPAEPLRP